MKWFRFYSEAVNDPKVQLLPPDLFRVWVNLLCLASQNGGDLPSVSDIAFRLRMSDRQADKQVGALVSAGLLDAGPVLRPHNWEGRQYESDGSASRVGRYRERRRELGLKSTSDYSAFRPELARRDGNACVYCGGTGHLVVDHMVPIQRGGTDDIDNLALACKRCNSGKAGRTPEEAGYAVIALSAVTALARYRVMKPDVTVTGSAPEQTQIQNRKEKKEPVVDTPEFLEFWAVYPKRPGDSRKEAARAHAKAMKAADPELVARTVLAGAQRYAARMKREGAEPKFIAMAATWLNQERWASEPEQGAFVAGATIDGFPMGPDGRPVNAGKINGPYLGSDGKWRKSPSVII